MSSSVAPAFSIVKWREGYSTSDVDTFLAEVTRALAGRLPDPALAERIEHAQFSPVRFRGGYDMGEVDDHLDDLVRLALQGHPRV